MNLTLKNKLYFILVIFLIMSLSIFIYLGFDVYKQLNVLNKTEELVYLSDKLSKFIHSIGANETSKDMEILPIQQMHLLMMQLKLKKIYWILKKNQKIRCIKIHLLLQRLKI